MLRRVVFEVGRFQRNHCALDGLGSDLDSCGVGRGRVFLIALRRGECPLSLIVAGFVGLGTRIRPLEGAFDRLAVVFHRASNGADAQDLAKGNRRCGDFAVHNGRELVLCEDVDGQGDVLIVARGDCNRNRAELSFVRAASVCFQCQLTGLAVYKGN